MPCIDTARTEAELRPGWSRNRGAPSDRGLPKRPRASLRYYANTAIRRFVSSIYFFEEVFFAGAAGFFAGATAGAAFTGADLVAASIFASDFAEAVLAFSAGAAAAGLAVAGLAASTAGAAAGAGLAAAAGLATSAAGLAAGAGLASAAGLAAAPFPFLA